MNIKSSNPIIYSKEPEKILPLYVKKLGYIIKHNLEFPHLNLLTLENGKNRIDFVVDADPSTKKYLKKDTYSIRYNVDNMKDALKALKAGGCTVAYENQFPAVRVAIVIQPNGLSIVVIEHIKKAVRGK